MSEQKDHSFEGTSGYTVKPCLKKGKGREKVRVRHVCHLLLLALALPSAWYTLFYHGHERVTHKSPPSGSCPNLPTKTEHQAGEMAQLLRALTALPKDLAHNHQELPSWRTRPPLCGHHMYMVHGHIDRQNVHIYKNKFLNISMTINNRTPHTKRHTEKRQVLASQSPCLFIFYSVPTNI